MLTFDLWDERVPVSWRYIFSGKWSPGRKWRKRREGELCERSALLFFLDAVPLTSISQLNPVHFLSFKNSQNVLGVFAIRVFVFPSILLVYGLISWIFPGLFLICGVEVIGAIDWFFSKLNFASLLGWLVIHLVDSVFEILSLMGFSSEIEFHLGGSLVGSIDRSLSHGGIVCWLLFFVLDD